MRLAWAEFLAWVENDPEANSTIVAVFEQVNSMVCDLNQEGFTSLVNCPLLTKLITKWIFS